MQYIYIDCHHASWVLLMVYYGKNPVEVTLVKSVEDSSERRRPMTTTTRRASEATYYSRGWCCCCMLVVASILSSAQHSLSSLASSSSTKQYSSSTRSKCRDVLEHDQGRISNWFGGEWSSYPINDERALLNGLFSALVFLAGELEKKYEI